MDTWHDEKGRTLLLAAIEDNDVALVEYLAPRSNLKNLCLVDKKEEVTPLMYAARLGRTDCVKVLLAHGPDDQPLWAGGERGDLPAVDLAAKHGHLDCIDLLAPLSKLRERQRLFPLVDAAKRGDLETMKRLLPHCPVNGHKLDGYTALRALICEGKPSTIRDACFDLLWDQPDLVVKPDGEDGYNNPTHQLLFDAIMNYQVHMVRRMVNRFDLNRLSAHFFGGRWSDNCTPLHQAVYWGATGCVEALLPGSTEALTLKASGGEYHDQTPVERALKMVANTPSLSNAATALKIADMLVAHGIRLGLDVPRPPLVDKEGVPLSADAAQALWPRMHQALEAQELERTLNGAAPPESRDRPRL